MKDCQSLFHFLHNLTSFIIHLMNKKSDSMAYQDIWDKDVTELGEAQENVPVIQQGIDHRLKYGLIWIFVTLQLVASAITNGVGYLLTDPDVPAEAVGLTCLFALLNLLLLPWFFDAMESLLHFWYKWRYPIFILSAFFCWLFWWLHVSCNLSVMSYSNAMMCALSQRI
ncbi:hypothetical protein M8C21_002431 [Ambrosia artemisiifolia]|uniref:Uncharacterized protein n=1 Tax=Ambrosia artemisiifolia TaxID=4212 RepID=A0AAD5C660_AMBAR|nr:hypothetical protein M8C21_002431 [Ambrosia artemisiifolia]